jgi:hypothetical protein
MQLLQFAAEGFKVFGAGHRRLTHQGFPGGSLAGGARASDIGASSTVTRERGCATFTRGSGTIAWFQPGTCPEPVYWGVPHAS